MAAPERPSTTADSDRRKFKRQDPSLKQLQELNESSALDMARDALHKQPATSRSYNTRQCKRPRQKYDEAADMEVPKARKPKQTKRPMSTDSDSTRDDAKDPTATAEIKKVIESKPVEKTQNKKSRPRKSTNKRDGNGALVVPEHYRCWPVVQEVTAFLHSEIPTLAELQAMGVFEVT